MANEVSVHRVWQSLLPLKSSVSSKTNVDEIPEGTQKGHPRDSASPPTAQVTSLSRAELRHAVEHLNELTRLARHDLQFSVDEDTGRTVIKVIDSQSDEVLREIPPKEILALIARFGDLNNGLVEEKA